MPAITVKVICEQTAVLWVNYCNSFINLALGFTDTHAIQPDVMVGMQLSSASQHIICLLLIVGSVTPAVVIQSSATQQLQFYPTANGVQALANGTLTPNYFKMFHVLDNTCNSNE